MSKLEIGQIDEFNDGLKRVISDLTKEALSYIDNAEEKGRHTAVHEVRKAFKKARAAFRLIRDHTGRDFYKEQNNFSRDRGREISAIRDAHSDIETLDLLVTQFEDQLTEDPFPNIYQSLRQNRENLAEEFFTKENRLEKIHEKLKVKLSEIENWNFGVESFSDIKPSIYRVYKRGYKGYRQSLESRKTEDIHDWRKRVKYLRYQLEMISNIWPQVLLVMEDELHDVSDFTGMYHDCTELLESVKGLEVDNFEEVELLRSIAHEHERNMIDLAFYTAEKFYYEKPNLFVDRIEAYWVTHIEYNVGKNITPSKKLEY